MSGGVAARNLRVVDLYRRILREIPRVITVFDMDLTEKELRKKVREQFKVHDGITDPRAIDRLLLRAELDLEETVNVWKQKAHVYRLLGMDEEPNAVVQEHQGESEFLRKFYNNKV